MYEWIESNPSEINLKILNSTCNCDALETCKKLVTVYLFVTCTRNI